MPVYVAQSLLAGDGTLLAAPTADGTNGQFLKTDGSGQLGWADVGLSGYMPKSGGTFAGDVTVGDGSTDSTLTINCQNSSTSKIELNRSGSTKAELYANGSSGRVGFNANDTYGFEVGFFTNTCSIRMTKESAETVRISGDRSSSSGHGNDLIVSGGSTKNFPPGDLWLMGGVNNAGTRGVVYCRDPLVAIAPSSTGTDREQATLVPAWATSTDASRKGRLVESVYDTAAREVRRIESDGSRGYQIQTVHTTAPADALLVNGSVAFYADGSGNLAIKLKDSGGTVRTGSVTLT